MAIGGKPQLEEINVRGVEPVVIPDPGSAGTIDTSHSGYCELTSAGAETRTLSDPAYRGEVVDLVFVSDGGDITMTASSPINQAGNNTLDFSDIGEHIRLVGFYNATDGWEWRVVANDGVVLSTV
mgnify:CR=1 FL=1